MSSQPSRSDHRCADRHRPRHRRRLCQGGRARRRLRPPRAGRRALAEELRGLGAEAEFIQADVRQDDGGAGAWWTARSPASAGWTSLVNNAGTEGKPGPVADQTADSYAATFDTNVLGTMLGMKHAMRVMRPQGQGSIVNVSSTMGHKGAPGASIYTASKHAVEGLTKSAALEGASFGVRVNAVAPGPGGDRHAEPVHRAARSARPGLIAGVPMQRAGRPEEIAQAIVFLASDKASFITGQILSVDGGKSAT